MSTVSTRRLRARPAGLPLLENGDRMTQPEFHRLYETYPDDVKIELIGGIVYLREAGASPLRWPHANYLPKLSFAMELYASRTPGVELGDNATTILSNEDEPQPDLVLRISTEFGGQSRINEDLYLTGAPELVAEVAHSTRAIDMHQKRDEYEQAGVREYLVLCVDEQELHWFNFRSPRPIKPNRQDIYRSQVFPGLWIDAPALLARDTPRLMEVVQQGLGSRDHAAFVKRLAREHRRRSQE